ncbi:putative oxidoreductase MhqP [compost metagenome]
MLHNLLQTDYNYTFTLIRVVSGIIIFPYGMQKLLGWFDDFGGGVGINESLASFAKKNISKPIAWMVIIGQSFGSVMLIIGFFGRIGAFFNLIIFTGAMLKHTSDGWVMNWTGTKKGEGIEYFIMLLALLLFVTINGSGAISMDCLLLNWYFTF